MGTVQIGKLSGAIKRGLTTLTDAPLEITPQISADRPFCNVIPLSAENSNPVAAVDENGKLEGNTGQRSPELFNNRVASYGHYPGRLLVLTISQGF